MNKGQKAERDIGRIAAEAAMSAVAYLLAALLFLGLGFSIGRTDMPACPTQGLQGGIENKQPAAMIPPNSTDAGVTQVNS